MTVQYTSNPALQTIKSVWKGTPITAKGRYVNHEYPFVPEFSKVWEWKTGTAPQAAEKKADTRRLPVSLDTSFFESSADGVLWLGHASFYIRLAGISFLIDPVYYSLPLVGQYIDVPNPIPAIKQLDYLLISHDHRDHCDQKSVAEVTKKYPNVKVLTGLGLGGLLTKWAPRTATVTEAGWYQRFVDTAECTVDYLPTRHWGRRSLLDTNRRLWGAFMIRVGSRYVYFGGDSGYGSHYRELAELYPSIDLVLMGIGAYSPRWFMHPSHMAPEDAVVAFADTGATRVMPMHYGKYDLSDEPPGEPRQLITNLMEEQGTSDQLLLPAVGEPFYF